MSTITAWPNEAPEPENEEWECDVLTRECEEWFYAATNDEVASLLEWLNAPLPEPPMRDCRAATAAGFAWGRVPDVRGERER